MDKIDAVWSINMLPLFNIFIVLIFISATCVSPKSGDHENYVADYEAAANGPITGYQVWRLSLFASVRG